MSFLYEIFPVFLFFLAFKWYGIYIATIVGIIVTAVQCLCFRLYKKHWDNKGLFTLLIFAVFGGMTLYFHNPIFVKWKPTVVFWMFAIITLISHFFMKKNIAQQLMEHVVDENQTLPGNAWRAMNLFWAIFFSLMGGINLYIAYYYDNEAWVNFKFYGITGGLLLFSILQALYLIWQTGGLSHDKSK